jgi:hypothetical protein
MSSDDTRHPTDAEMEALEAIVHPEGRCAVCGGGKPYWKHTANETEYHPFTQSVRAASERLGILPVGPRGQEVVRPLPPEIVHPAPFTEDWNDPAMDVYDTPPNECAVCGTIPVGTFPLCGAHGRYGGVDLVPDATLDAERARHAALVAAAQDLSRVGDVHFSEDQLLATVPAYKMLALRAALDGEPKP